MSSAADHALMARALVLAEQGLWSTDPNPRVGCVIVRDGQIVGEGAHLRAGEPHAEALALQQAGDRARDATVFVTLEPCCHFGRTPPCTSALIAAGVRRVVAAMEDPNPRVAGQGFAQLRAAGIAVDWGLQEAAARALNPGFISRMTRKRPWVRMKLAMSLDGRTALANGDSQWITGAAARTDGHRWRARSSAILTGRATVQADNPQLTARLPGVTRQPLRVILDTHGQLDLTHRVFDAAADTLLITGPHVADRWANQHRVPLDASGRLDLPTVMAALAQREVNELHVESGATLAGALLQAELIDEYLIYVAPKLLGDAARPLLQFPLRQLAHAPTLHLTEWRAVGDDWRLLAHPATAPSKE